MVKVEVVYVRDQQTIMHLGLTLENGTTVGDALQQSGWLVSYPEIMEQAVGIFGKKVSFSTVLQSGDRVEIYRPLVLSPKERRRRRALDR